MSFLELLFGTSTQNPAVTSMVKVDRNKKFDIHTFLPDEKTSLQRSEYQFSGPLLVYVNPEFRATLVNYGHFIIDGDTRVRSQYGHGRQPLDAEAMQSIWEVRDELPEYWRTPFEGRPLTIYFDGTPFVKAGNDEKFSLFMRFDGEKWQKGLESQKHWHGPNGRAAIFHFDGQRGTL